MNLIWCCPLTSTHKCKHMHVHVNIIPTCISLQSGNTLSEETIMVNPVTAIVLGPLGRSGLCLTGAELQNYRSEARQSNFILCIKMAQVEHPQTGDSVLHPQRLGTVCSNHRDWGQHAPPTETPGSVHLFNQRVLNRSCNSRHSTFWDWEIQNSQEQEDSQDSMGSKKPRERKITHVHCQESPKV